MSLDLERSNGDRRKTANQILKVPQISQKRKDPAVKNSNVSRKRQALCTAYVRLLNDDIREASSIAEPRTRNRTKHSDLASASWTPLEKDSFYHHLLKRRNNLLHGSENELHSKSDVEFLDLRYRLEQQSESDDLDGMLYRKLYQQAPRTEVGYAFELRESCCKALEKASEAVSHFQWAEDTEKAEQEFGEFGIVTNDTLQELQRIVLTRSNPPDLHSVPGQRLGVRPMMDLKAANALLDIKNWLETSENIFMNSPIAAEVQNSGCQSDDVDSPAIFATALLDFANLAVSVTKRLVSTTLFQASSRLRATDVPNASSKKHLVKKSDVMAAIDILGLQSSSKEFWRGAARRCNLEVYLERPLSISSGQTDCEIYNEKLSYSEIESQLSEGSFDTERNAQMDSHAAPFDFESSKYESSKPFMEPISTNEQHSSSNNLSENAYSDSEEDDGYIDECDRLESSREESRMWNILGNFTGLEHETIHGSNMKQVTRRNWDTPMGWRSRTDYRSEWERYGKAPSQLAFGST